MLDAALRVPAAGLVLVPVNTRLSRDEIGYILKHSGARALFVDQEFEPLVTPLDLPGVTVIRVDDTGAPGDPVRGLPRRAVGRSRASRGSRTSSRRSRSTTPPAPPGVPRAS